MLPKALTNLINALGELPGVGPRTAERYAYFLLKNQDHSVKKIASSLIGLKENISICPITFELIDSSQKLSPIYQDNSRDKKTVAVVEDVFDVVAIEHTGAFKGTYHVLGGLISPIDSITPELLHIPELLKRVDKDKVKEVIIATNATIEGESTAHYIQKQLQDRKISITRPAQGLPIGLDIEYADQITLSRALEGRKAV